MTNPSHAAAAVLTGPSNMRSFYDVKFKYPCGFDGHLPHETIDIEDLSGCRHFCIGVNAVHTFSYLKIYDDRGDTRFESELSNISLSGLESLIMWRISTPVALLRSMAGALLGVGADPFHGGDRRRVLKLKMHDGKFKLPLSLWPLHRLMDKACVMLIERSDQKCVHENVLDKGIVVFSMA